MEKAAPGLAFSMFKIGIGNYLHAANRADYDLSMLEAFAQYRLYHPPRQGFDLAADARAFEEWRAANQATNRPG